MAYYQAMGRKKGDTEWKPITYSGETFLANDEGLPKLHQMTHFMAEAFKKNEYVIREVPMGDKS